MKRGFFKKFFSVLIISVLFFLSISVFLFGSNFSAEAMDSLNYKIISSDINAGGRGDQTSTTYKIKDTIGGITTGISESALYKLMAGYRTLTTGEEVVQPPRGGGQALAGLDVLPPANISNFEAIAGDGQITLKWQNPIDPDFKAVRIMRSEDFYPQDPEQGKLVYNSKETSFADTGLINGKRYYYTAFSYDFSSNFSSGAIVSAVPWSPEIAPPVIPLPPEVLPPIVPPPPEVEKITIDDFDFIQAGRKIQVIDGKLEIKKEEQLEILINYDKVPEVLKTITVTLEKGEKFLSFLLRINKEKTAYSATLMPPDEPGVYLITIAVLDYKNQTLKQITGQLTVFESAIPPAPVPWYKKYQVYIYILLAILVLGGITYFYLKRINTN